MELVLWLALGFVVLAWGVLPLTARRSFWFSARPGPHAVDRSSLPVDVAAVLDARGAEVEALGFSHVTYATVPESMPDTTLHHRVLVDASRTIVAAVTVVVAKQVTAPAITAFGSRAREEGGGWREISATDSAEFMAIRPAGDLVTQRPGASPGELLALHREALSAQPASEWMTIGSPIDAMREDLERVVEHGLASGLFVPDAETPGRQRLSLPGAYRMVWANLPPMTWIRRRGR